MSVSVMMATPLKLNPRFGVQETVLLVNRVFVPPKEGVFDENGENDEFAFLPINKGFGAQTP